MPREDTFSGVITYCCMCGNPVGDDRPKKAITCSKECSDRRKKWRLSKLHASRCLYCLMPSSLAERSRYKRWRRWEQMNPPPEAELSPEELKKRGPKPKPEPVIVSHTDPKTSPFDTIEDTDEPPND